MSGKKTAMRVSGHKTDSVFSRYNIVSEADIRGAVRKIEQGAQAEISQFRVNSESERIPAETDEKEDTRKPS